MLKLARLLFLVVLCGLALPAWAADETPPLEAYVQVDASALPTSNTIATKLDTPLRLTPANVGVVTGDLARAQRALVLGDALRNVSGVNVQTQSGIFDYFVVRGFDSLSSGLVLTDGAREPEATYYQMYNVEGVEILKGPSGFLYGSDPMAGVVNIVRKQPLPADFLSFGATAGSFGSYEGTLDWNAASDSGAHSFRLNGTWTESEHYRDAMDSEQLAVNPSFTWRPDGETRLNVNLEYVKADYQPDSGIPLLGGAIPDVPRRRSYQTPFDFSEQDVFRAQVDYETKINDSLLIRNKTYLRRLEWLTDGTVFNGVFPTGPGGSPEVSRTLTRLDDTQTFTANQFEAIATWGDGRVKHRLLAGIEVAHLADEFTLELLPPANPLTPLIPGVPAIDLFDPVETLTFVTGFPFQAGDSERLILAPYVIEQMEFPSRLRLLLGARFDYIDDEDDLNAVARIDRKVSPMAGVLYAPTDDLSFYANTARSFAPASPRILGEREPEESSQVEVGVKMNLLGGRLQTTAAAYQLDRDNVGITDATGFTQQAGDQRSRGVELELAAEVRRGMRALLSYAFTDAELTHFVQPLFGGGTADFSGNRPAFAPKNLVNLWINQEFQNGWGLGLGARHFDDQFISEDNAFEIDGAWVLDTAVSYAFEDCRVNVHLKNLTDEEYATRGFGSTSVIPADGFAAYGGFECRF